MVGYVFCRVFTSLRNGGKEEGKVVRCWERGGNCGVKSRRVPVESFVETLSLDC